MGIMDFHSLSDYGTDPRSIDPREESDHKREPVPTRESSPLESITRYITAPREISNSKTRGEHDREQADRSRTRTREHSRDIPRQRPIAPRRKRRERDPALGLQLRSEERRLLVEVGKFRVIAATDLEREIYKGNSGQFRHDLEFLKQHGLIERHVLNLRRDGSGDRIRRFDAVTLTEDARKQLILSGHVPEGQELYSGLVKPREAEHDAQIYRAYLKEAAEIERAGGKNIRVRLDFELKREINRAVLELRKADRTRDDQNIKQEVADRFDLNVQNHRIVLPDARLEYELPGNGGSSHVDIEVATSAYHRSHIASKVQAGFKLYISSGDIGRLGAGVTDDHDLMSEILDI
jgi:hypothetical protein